MKKVIHLTSLLICAIGISQTEIPFYEQIAFDFYRTDILIKHPVEKKINIYKEIEPYKLIENPFWHPRCLAKFDLKEFDDSDYNLSGKSELNLNNIDQRKFKIKKYRKGKNPKLYVSQSLLFDQNRILVMLTEVYKWRGNIYYIELDNNGIVTNWCKSEYIN